MSINPVWFAVASLYAVCLTVALCQSAPDIARRWALMDHPGTIKQHSESTPLIGGVALVLVLGALLPIFMFIFEPEGLGNRALSVITGATLLIAALGIWDDRRAISAYLRFGVVGLIFALAIALEPRLVIKSLLITGMGSSDTIPSLIAYPLTLLILTGFVNAVNMADGKNGLVICMCLIWLPFLLGVGPEGLIIVVLPLIQMLGVLLIYNLRGRIFLGDGGTYGLAAFVAMISIYCYNFDDAEVAADTLALLYLVPGIDMLRLFFMRLMSGKSPFFGDRNHLHHLFKDYFGWPQGLIGYLVLVSIPILAATFLREMTLGIFVVGLLMYAATYVWLTLERRAGRTSAPRTAGDQPPSSVKEKSSK